MALTEPSSVTMSFRGLATFAGRDVDRTVVWLQGEHDVSTTVALAGTLARAVALDDADLVIDLSEVQFMSAATVGIIVRTHGLLAQQSRSLTLRAPSRCARRVLELCGVVGDLDLAPADTTPETTTASALGSWVTVPAADRADLPAAAPSPDNATDPGRVVPLATNASSTGNDDPTDERTTLAAQGGM
jgi:anti-anti-sigma factor